MAKFNLFMLAAGLGTRLRPLTNTFPKPSVPLLNMPMGFYQFQYLLKSEVASVVVNTHHLPKKIKDIYSSQTFLSNKIQFSDEAEKILGGAGALKKAASLMDPTCPIVLCNADEVYLAKNSDLINSAVDFHVKNKALATVVVMNHPEAGSKFGGVWCDADQRIRIFGKTKDLPPLVNVATLKPWHAIGVTILSNSILNRIPEDQETNIFYDTLLPVLESEKCLVYPSEMVWYETGNPQDYLQTTAELLQTLTPELLSFISCYDKSFIYKTNQSLNLISCDWLVQQAKFVGCDSLSPGEVFAKSQLSFVGWNVIAKSAGTLKNKTIKDSVLFDRLVVNEHYFRNSVSV